MSYRDLDSYYSVDTPTGGVEPTQLEQPPVDVLYQENKLGKSTQIVDRNAIIRIHEMIPDVKSKQKLKKIRKQSKRISTTPRIPRQKPRISTTPREKPRKVVRAPKILSHIVDKAEIGLNNTEIEEITNIISKINEEQIIHNYDEFISFGENFIVIVIQVIIISRYPWHKFQIVKIKYL